MPTFLSVAGASYPETYTGSRIVKLQGHSLLPALSAGNGNDAQAQSEPRELGWSSFGMHAYRRGDWKAIRLPSPYGNDAWQLYDLAADPGEQHDLAAAYPYRLASLARAWQIYADSNGVIQPETASFNAKPVAGKKF